MPPSTLSALQEQVLVALSGLQPAWTLTGGAALAGFYPQHRATRDLDLFFHHERTLGSLVPDATHALVTAGVSVTALRTTATFAQLDVRRVAEAQGAGRTSRSTPSNGSETIWSRV